MYDGPVRVIRVWFDAIGVVPEIDPVDVSVVEPEPDMVRVVDALARPRVEREPSGHNGAGRCPQRIKNRLFQRIGPNVRGKGLAVDGYIDAARGVVDADFNAALVVLL